MLFHLWIFFFSNSLTLNLFFFFLNHVEFCCHQSSLNTDSPEWLDEIAANQEGALLRRDQERSG